MTFGVLGAVLCVAVLSVSAWLVYTYVLVPNKAYNEAAGLMDEGKYKQAAAAFDSLGGYKDSAEKARACDTAVKDAAYDEAVGLMDAGKYEKAIAAFEALEGYRDSTDKAEECKAMAEAAPKKSSEPLEYYGVTLDVPAGFSAQDYRGEYVGMLFTSPDKETIFVLMYNDSITYDDFMSRYSTPEDAAKELFEIISGESSGSYRDVKAETVNGKTVLSVHADSVQSNDISEASAKIVFFEDHAVFIFAARREGSAPGDLAALDASMENIRF